MEHYILKSAVVAEIEKLYNGEIDTYTRNILDRLKSNIDTLEVKEVQEEPVSNPMPNEKMSVERWKKACEAACCDMNYRSHYGLTETRDDYFVDGVQWADEHPKEEPVNEELEEASRNYADDEEYGDDVYFAIKAAFKAGAKWHKERIMAKAVDAKLLEGYLIRQKEVTHPLHVGYKVKVIVIKEDKL